jgi:hypothetical protein
MVLALGMLLGAVGSRDPLVRLTCLLTLTAGAVVLVAAMRLGVQRLWRLQLAVFLVMGMSFAAVAATFEACGGGALNGRATSGGEYYLRKGGTETAVSRTVYYSVALAEMAMFVSWPLGLLLGAWPTRLRTTTPPAER